MAPAAEEADATLPVARRKRRRLLVLVGLAAVGLTAILASLVVFGGRNSKQPGTYVALGDSYASGEGLGPFEAGTEDVARSGDGCHRSANAYPRLVAAEGLKVIFVACSGAKVADLVGGQAPQAALVDKRATLVTVTIGGNDAQWTEVLTVCGLVENCPTAPMPASAAGPSGGATVSEFVVRQLEGLAGPLRESFEQLRRSAPNATMLVTGYPLPLPTGELATTDSACALLANVFEPAERLWLAERVTDLNNLLADAANAAGLIFVDVAASFGDHAACSPKEAWINGILLGGGGRLVGSGSFHPNAEGQRQLALAVERARGD